MNPKPIRWSEGLKKKQSSDRGLETVFLRTSPGWSSRMAVEGSQHSNTTLPLPLFSLFCLIDLCRGCFRGAYPGSSEGLPINILGSCRLSPLPPPPSLLAPLCLTFLKRQPNKKKWSKNTSIPCFSTVLKFFFFFKASIRAEFNLYTINKL